MMNIVNMMNDNDESSHLQCSPGVAVTAAPRYSPPCRQGRVPPPLFPSAPWGRRPLPISAGELPQRFLFTLYSLSRMYHQPNSGSSYHSSAANISRVLLSLSLAFASAPAPSDGWRPSCSQRRLPALAASCRTRRPPPAHSSWHRPPTGPFQGEKVIYGAG